MVKISVIVPVYNVEKYIDKAVESLKKQTIGDIQIILVNDGSRDNSMEICEKHRNEDSRVTLINKDNGGVSSARNAGLAVAEGEYVAFLDPDDWVDKDMYEQMYNTAKSDDLDACICNFFREFGGKSVLNKMSLPKDTESDLSGYIALNMVSGDSVFDGDSNTIMGSVCRLLVKRDFIEELNLRFKEDVHIMEDLIFCLEIFLRANSVGVVEEPYYHYRDNPDSALNSYRADLYSQIMQVHSIMENILREAGFYAQDFVKRLNLRYIRICFWAISNEGSLKNKKPVKDKIRTISGFCSDPELEKLLEGVDIKGYSFQQRLRIMSVKHKASVFIYFYMRVLNRIRLIASVLKGYKI